MGFVLIRDGKRIDRRLEGTRTLAEILTDSEYQRVQEGSLVALTDNGGLMSLDSPLTEGQTIVLRPLQPAKDLAGFGFAVNRAGDVVGISELLGIRVYEERHATDVYDLSLDEIRRRVRADGGAAPSRNEQPEVGRKPSLLLEDLRTPGCEEQAVERLRQLDRGARDHLLDAIRAQQATNVVEIAAALLRVVGGLGNVALRRDPPTPEDQRWAAQAARRLAPSSTVVAEQCARLEEPARPRTRTKAPAWAPGRRAAVAA